MVLGRLQADTNDIALRHVTRVSVGVHLRQREVAVLGLADQPVLAYVFEVAVQQEVQFAPGVLQSRAIEPTECPRTDDGITSLLHEMKVSQEMNGCHPVRRDNDAPRKYERGSQRQTTAVHCHSLLFALACSRYMDDTLVTNVSMNVLPQFRKGTTVLAVLSALDRGETYGYEIRRE